MVDSTRKLQLKLLELMKIFHDVCERYNIKYYMLGGTMLGAIRHKGFIPWDDDMDVGLPRKDYDRLISLPQKAWPDNIHIKTPYNSEDLIFPYSKLMDKNTTLVEDRLDGIIGGIYIDLFPLDGAGNDMFSAKIMYYSFYWKLGLLYNNQDYGNKKNMLRRLVQNYARSKDIIELYKNVEKCMRKKDYYESSIIGNYAGAWGLREFMPRKYMGEPTLYTFEDSKFYGPENSDEYLKSLYGDYIKLPPVEKRKSHHNIKYLNLDLPYSEYKNLMKVL